MLQIADQLSSNKEPLISDLSSSLGWFPWKAQTRYKISVRIERGLKFDPVKTTFPYSPLYSDGCNLIVTYHILHNRKVQSYNDYG